VKEFNKEDTMRKYSKEFSKYFVAERRISI
jgi:hypothetical protein